MTILTGGVFTVLPILYTILVIAYARNFLGALDGFLVRQTRPLLILTVVTHATAVLLRGFEVGQCPVGTAGEALSVVAITISVIYLILEWRCDDRSTGVFVLSAAFALQLIATLAVLDQEPDEIGKLGSLISVHAFAALVGLSAIAVAAAYGLLYIALYRSIKTGRFGLFFDRVAPLESLADLNYLATRIAWGFLTISLGVGYAVAARESSWSEYFRDPQVILSSLLWLLYGSSIACKVWLSIGGPRLAFCTVLGLPLLVVIGFVSVLGRGFHG